MNSITGSIGRMRRVPHLAASAILAVAAIGVPVVAAGSAAAAPAGPNLDPGTGWTEANLPTGFFVRPGAPGQVSCVTGTQFCVAIVNNTTTGWADVVTTDGGQDWNGYTDLPTQINLVGAISCVSTSICWLTGQGVDGSADVAETTDGGQTWTDMTPSGWTDHYISESVSCVSATDCWVVGLNWDPLGPDPQGETPWAANTTDGGATWTISTNLPTIPQYDPNGTYRLWTISCTSVLDCTAAGGLDVADGLAQVISTTDGGDTWQLSTDPTLLGIQDIFGISCLSAGTGLPVCSAAGSALEASAPVEITSTDGGATWNGMETLDNSGWFSSIACADVQHCWVAGAGTKLALAGTADGGASWSEQKADTSNEQGTVSCASADFCVTTAGNDVWFTTTDGGLEAKASGLDSVTAKKPVSQSLPKVTASTVWARTGQSLTITGQYRGNTPETTAAVVITPQSGSPVTASVPLGLNKFYSVTIGKVAPGNTTVTMTVGTAQPDVVHVHSHLGPAPVITGLSTHAGPVGGGNTVTITGSHFGSVTNVLFGSLPGTAIKVLSSTKLTVRAPAGVKNGYISVVTKGGGPSALTGHAVYNSLNKPTITKVSPASGPAKGGTTVKVFGTDLAFIRSVHFGAGKGTHLIVVSPREIKIVAPAGHGTVDVRVTTAGGLSALVKVDHFKY